jgi:lipoate-protein ligase A
LHSSPLFDVELFRPEPHRLAVVRAVERPTLVLGSTQPADLVNRLLVRAGRLEVVRRRGGGGAVYLEPESQVWIDAWIPRADPLWVADVAAAAAWAGAWWVAALEAVGLSGLDVHVGRAMPGDFGELVCFAGRGSGEVFSGGRKVMGLSQWRSREGALFSACAYARWAPIPLLEALGFDIEGSGELVDEVSGVAVGIEELGSASGGLTQLADALLSSFEAWGAGG